VICLSVPLTSVYIVLTLAMSLSLLFFVSSVQFVSNELLNEHCSCSDYNLFVVEVNLDVLEKFEFRTIGAKKCLESPVKYGNVNPV